MADLVVQSKIKDAIKNLELRMDGTLPAAIDAKVQEMLTQAAARAKENGRSTLRPHDL